MRSWMDTLTCAAFCSVIVASFIFFRNYMGVAAPLSLAGSITYLWATRWRHHRD